MSATKKKTAKAVRRDSVGETRFSSKWLEGKWPYVLLAAGIFLLYARTIAFDYTKLDDTTLIAENKDFLSHFGNISKAFGQNVFSMLRFSGDTYYRPMLTVSFIIDYQFGHESPAFYHFANILFHIIACCLLFRFLVLLGYRREWCFVFAALFAFHPALTQAIAWIPGRNDSLMTIWVLASFIFLVSGLRERSVLKLVLHVLFFLLALFTKESAVLVPVLFTGWMLLCGEKIFSKEKLAVAGGWLIAALLFIYMRKQALTGQPGVPFGEVMKQVAGSLLFVFSYLGKLLLPVQLSVYPVAEDQWILHFIAGAVLVFGIAAIAWKKRLIRSHILFGCVWMILLLLPALIRTSTDQEQALLEHRLYLPAIGLIIAAAGIFNQLKQVDYVKASKVIFGIALLFGAISFFHESDFKNEEAFWTSAVESSPHSSVAWCGVGIYEHDKDIQKAQRAYEEAIRLNPGAPTASGNLAQIYLRQGRCEEARVLLRHEAIVRPLENVFANLGEALLGVDSLAAAETWLQKALEMNPDNFDAISDLATLYAKQGKYDEAIPLLEKAEAMQPERTAATQNLMVVYVKKKDFAKAEIYRQKLIAKGMNVQPLAEDSTEGKK